MNQILTYLIGFLVTIGGAIGLVEDPFSQDISDNVQSVDDVVTGVQTSLAQYQAGTIGIGQFRADWQDAQQFINGEYQGACKDTSLNQEQKELNEKYKAYLVECSKVVDSYSNGQVPDVTLMEELKDELD